MRVSEQNGASEAKALNGVELCHSNILGGHGREAFLVVVAACSGKGKTRMLPYPWI